MKKQSGGVGEIIKGTVLALLRFTEAVKGFESAAAQASESFQDFGIKAQTLPLLYLAQEWKARQTQYEKWANDPELSDYNRAKFTYKATATRDCHKELLAVLKG